MQSSCAWCFENLAGSDEAGLVVQGKFVLSAAGCNGNITWCDENYAAMENLLGAMAMLPWCDQNSTQCEGNAAVVQ